MQCTPYILYIAFLESLEILKHWSGERMMGARPPAFGKECLVVIRLGEEGKLRDPEEVGVGRQLQRA